MAQDGTDKDGDCTDEKDPSTPLFTDDIIKDFMKEFVHFALFDHILHYRVSVLTVTVSMYIVNLPMLFI